MQCPICGSELLPEFIESLAGKKERRYLQYGKKQEPAFYCPGAVRLDGHGVNLWTVTWIVCYLRMIKRRKKLKMSY